jgi:predicted AAA+ superfamily ATPase
MPHKRDRFLKETLSKALSFSPIVGILGQRQVGKTTLAREWGENNYFTFDSQDTLEFANSSPKEFLNQKIKLMIIDECQKSPNVFPALKLHVLKANNRPGQFILTGSIRFTSSKAIQESLTGRIVSLELLPMTLAEMNLLPLGNFSNWHNMTDNEFNKKLTLRTQKLPSGVQDKLLLRGGLPGFWFLRDKSLLKIKMKAHIETLLQRDINLIIKTTLAYPQLLELLVYFAKHQCEPFNSSEASRICQISPNTLKKIIFAFESMFLVRRMDGLDYVRAPAYFLEDQGMASFLTSYSQSQDALRFAISQLFAQAHYNQNGTMETKYFTTKGGAHIPIVFKIDNIFHGFLISRQNPKEHFDIRSASVFLKSHPKGRVTILDPLATSMERISHNIIRVPLLSVV